MVSIRTLSGALSLAWIALPVAGAVIPSPQSFHQEMATHWSVGKGLPEGDVQLVDQDADGIVRVLIAGRWHRWAAERWEPVPGLVCDTEETFVFPGRDGQAVRVELPWREVRQILRHPRGLWLATALDPFQVVAGQARSLGWPSRYRINQIAAAAGGTLYIASSAGLFRQTENGWVPLRITDEAGRAWAIEDVRGVAFDGQGRLWFATLAGVGCRTGEQWAFYTGQEGLPWNDFAGVTAGLGDEIWFATRLGAVRFDGKDWHYRQGPRWLPHDDVRQILVDGEGSTWLATAGGVGRLQAAPMTFAEKAAFYEIEIERYIKRTPLGYVAEAPLGQPAQKDTARPNDSDNDGLWTAMYGAGECFAYAATQDPQAQVRARKAFEALRFLQRVTQGGAHAPPPGYVARTIRSTQDPDPNRGRLERDRQAQQGDKLWKVYEPRWPTSADGKWYWKSDTSSDELDGHYFFYPLYYDFCADTEAERERVREVVRGVTDHLIEHGFVLIDHDGQPTRWAIFGPQYLNRDPDWWAERGLNSLSLLSYLAVASHVTGDPKYAAASRELIDRHGYAQNAMYPKVQQGPGSGNQSDDEMAFMCYYSLLRCSTDEALKAMIRLSFLRYWVNEAPEMNPFFNFAYAAHSLGREGRYAFGTIELSPRGDWQRDALATLRGFSLDRLNWAHRNSHRLDLQRLPWQAARDVYEAGRERRAYRVNGKVLPVENRHFNHWNTDPWRLDYGGQGNVLASGTVFLLPYYMGLHHGFIEKPVGKPERR